MQGESNSKAGKQCFTRLDTAEPQLIFCKDYANERKESLLSIFRVQLIFCKDTTKSLLPEIFVFTIFTVNITFINAGRALYAQPHGSAVPSSNAS